MNKEEQIQKYESKLLIDELSKMPPMVIATAYLHAINYTLYGEDVTERWLTATQQACILGKAYNKGYSDALYNYEQRQEPCEDCISRQAVLGCLTATKLKKFDFILHAREEIKKLPPVTPQPKTGWIPVSERLPKAGEYIGDVDKYYLVQNEYGDMLVARYTHSEYWEQIYQLRPLGDKIVAWRELPQPYKAESEE